jgi:hypothetical protein
MQGCIHVDLCGALRWQAGHPLQSGIKIELGRCVMFSRPPATRIARHACLKHPRTAP